LYEAIQGTPSGMEQVQQKILKHRHGMALQAYKRIYGALLIRHVPMVIPAGHFGSTGSREAISQPTYVSTQMHGNQSKVYHHTLPGTPSAKVSGSRGIETLKRGIML
jgi:hypothetical protein